MAYKSPAYFDGGADMLRTAAGTANRIRVHLLSAFSAADSWATITANSLANAALVAGDIVSSGAAGSSRVVTFAGKAATATAADADLTGCVVAVLDHTSQVAHYVTSGSASPAAISVGQTASIATFTDTLAQPA
jgi:hypothetical protein